MTRNEAICEAYSRLHRYGPEYGGDEEGNHGMTNHAPMAVEVIVRRQLDVDLDHWLDRYVRRLDELPTDRAALDNWRSALGDHRQLPAWTGFFTQELQHGHWIDVLAQWWPRLLPGMVAGSTHGVIRVGHAVRTLRVNQTDQALMELANGLAFWAARYRLLPITEHAVQVDADLALQGVPRLAHQTGFIAHRLARLGPLPPRPDAPDALTGLHTLIDAATRSYLSYGYASPVLLVHTATAPNAVLQVLPVLPKDLWQASYDTAWASAAALMAMYAPTTSQPPAQIEPGTVDAVLDQAGAHGDEHVLKFTDTVVDAYARRPDPDLLRAARHAGALIGAPE